MSAELVNPAEPVEAPDAIVAAACDELLDRFVRQSERHLRKVGDALYEDLLISVQSHLKSNANWNLANEIERCRRVEAENRALTEQRDELVRSLQGLTRFIGGIRWGHSFPGRPHAEMDEALALIAKATGAA